MAIHLLFGGSFDPVHVGHIQVIEDLRNQFEIARAFVLPCYQPPHKGQLSASPKQRLEMLELAVGDRHGVLVDDRELARSGPSYSIDTLSSLREELGPNTALAFVLGSDLVSSLGRWHQAHRLCRVGHVIVLQRPNYALDMQPAEKLGFKIADLEQLSRVPNGLVAAFSPAQVAVSSTQIRERVQKGEDVANQLNDAVYAYICDNGLYQ